MLYDEDMLSESDFYFLTRVVTQYAMACHTICFLWFEDRRPPSIVHLGLDTAKEGVFLCEVSTSFLRFFARAEALCFLALDFLADKACATFRLKHAKRKVIQSYVVCDVYMYI